MEYLLRLGELTLKMGRSRERFEERLLYNVRDALESNGLEPKRLVMMRGRVYIEVDQDAMDVLRRVFGVVGVAEVVSHKFRTLDDVVERGVEVFGDMVRGKSFGVRTKRIGRHDFTSLDVNKALGRELLRYGSKVDLTNPDIWVRLEIRGDTTYYILREKPGYGGLPIGTGGTVLSLFSGGFDSPVAAWMVMRRGVEVNMVHFQLGGENHFHKVLAVAIRLARRWGYGYRPTLYRVDFRPIVKEIRDKVRQDYRIVVLKRLMYKAASILLEELGGEALVTGESIGQVSSQTLRNLVITDRAVRDTVLRPLIGLDKNDIIGFSREIGLYNLSEKVEEVCALVEDAPVVWGDEEVAVEEESKIDEELLKNAVMNRVKYVLRDLDEIDIDSIDSLGVEPDSIPEDSVIIDIRGKFSYTLGHIPGSINMSPDELLSNAERFKGGGRPVVVVCPVGLESIDVVKKLREMGVEAYYLLGGYRGYRLTQKPQIGGRN